MIRWSPVCKTWLLPSPCHICVDCSVMCSRRYRLLTCWLLHPCHLSRFQNPPHLPSSLICISLLLSFVRRHPPRNLCFLPPPTLAWQRGGILFNLLLFFLEVVHWLFFSSQSSTWCLLPWKLACLFPRPTVTNDHSLVALSTRNVSRHSSGSQGPHSLLRA